jgi:hypothetical protein
VKARGSVQDESKFCDPVDAAGMAVVEGRASAPEIFVACAADFPNCHQVAGRIAVPASKCACFLAREAYRPYLPQVTLKASAEDVR